MPSSLTHYIFSKDLVKNEIYRDIFLLGSQGADTLFFYGYNLAPREDKKKISDFGFYLHSINPSELFFRMLGYAFKKDGEEKDVLVEFTRGFIYHYILDRTIHPYVFYNTGFPYKKKKYKLNHGFFEGALDTALMLEYNCKISNRKALKTKNKYVKLCSNMLSEVCNDLMGEGILKKDSYYKAYKDFRFVRLFVDSKYGIKKAFYNKFLHESPVNTLCQPCKIIDNIDYLNLNKNKWLNPCSGELYNLSVKELFKKAYDETTVVDTIIYNYKENVVTKRKLDKLVNNINHDGKPLDSNMRYFANIYKKDC